jgi:hypothetical protein
MTEVEEVKDSIAVEPHGSSCECPWVALLHIRKLGRPVQKARVTPCREHACDWIREVGLLSYPNVKAYLPWARQT